MKKLLILSLLLLPAGCHPYEDGLAREKARQDDMLRRSKARYWVDYVDTDYVDDRGEDYVQILRVEDRKTKMATVFVRTGNGLAKVGEEPLAE